jgi:hypothetical protein
MKSDKKYWAIVGRIPDGENVHRAFANPMTLQQALGKFNGIVAADLPRQDKSRLKLLYGTVVIHEVIFASDSPIVYPWGL